MIVWRGWGLLVLVFGVIGVIAGMGPGYFIATQYYPGDPYAFDLLTAFQPMIFSACVGVSGVVAAGLTWFVGRAINRQAGVHTLFFIPVQWWSIAFVGIAGFVVYDAFARDGVARTHSSFVSSCATHEEGATEAMCECLATKVEAHSDPKIIVPFYAELEKSWRDSSRQGNVIGDFVETYLPRLPQSQSDAFAASLDEGLSCFDARDLAPPVIPSTPPQEPAPAAPKPATDI